jgi:hypothetical protein
MTRRWLVVLVTGLTAGAVAAQDAPALKNEKDKVSYALGVGIANQLRAQSVEVNPDALSQGLKDAVSGGETLLTAREVAGIVAGLRKQVRTRPAASQGHAPRAPGGPAGIAVSFKLDPRLATPTYGGERWVSPPTYTRMGEGKTCTVEARAQGLDATGRRVPISPQWTSADPDMVSVTPSVGNDVRILVQRAGESTLRVSSAGLTKELAIKAVYQNDVLQAAIAQR